MAFTEDLSVFFSTDDFAVAATYDGSTTVNVIFDRDYLQALGVAASTNPHALARASDIPYGGVGKQLEIGGVLYRIRSREPQDDGAIVLLELTALSSGFTDDTGFDDGTDFSDS